MDVERLKIERRAAAPARRRKRRLPIVKLGIAVAILAGLLFLVREPIGDAIARARYPNVETAPVVRRSAAAVAAIAGAAANGYVVARVRAALSADAPGRIVEMNVEEGQNVPKGFVVARLYSEEFEAALRRAESDLEAGKAALERARAEKEAAEAAFRELEARVTAAKAAVREIAADRQLAQVQLDRVRRLLSEGTVTVAERDEAEARLEVAEARLATNQAQLASADAALAEGRSRVAVAEAAVEESAARAQALAAARDLAGATLEKTSVRAPFDGIVVLKDAEVGEVVSPNSQAGGSARGAVATMVDFASLEAQAEVPESSIGAVKIGAPVRIILDAFPDHIYKGRVDRVWPTANRQKGTIEVRATFAEPDDQLRPEMGLRIVFLDPEAAEEARETQPRGDALLIPESALVRPDAERADSTRAGEETNATKESNTTRWFTFVVKGDVAERREIEVVETANGRAFVTKGLEEEERVVVDPPADLHDGDRVYVVEEDS